MLFYCYSESCHVHHECDCQSKCCMGFYYSARVIGYEDEDLTAVEKEGLVIDHVCPYCSGWVEC